MSRTNTTERLLEALGRARLWLCGKGLHSWAWAGRINQADERLYACRHCEEVVWR